MERIGNHFQGGHLEGTCHNETVEQLHVKNQMHLPILFGKEKDVHIKAYGRVSSLNRALVKQLL